MVSALLGFMTVSGLLGQKNLQRIRVQVLPEEDLYAQQSGQLTLLVENQRRWLTGFLISIEIGASKELIPLLPAGQRQRTRIALTPGQRGYQPLPEIWVRSCFPVNFFVRGLQLPAAEPVLVFPQPQSALSTTGSESNTLNRQQELPQQGIDGEVRSIDDYQSNDPLKAIHWKLSARHDALKVRRHNRLGAPSLLLNLDDFTGSLEQRLGQCTFVINQAIRSGQAVGLRCGEVLHSPSSGGQQRLKLLKELALYDQH